MSYLEELLPEFRKGAKIRMKDWEKYEYICIKDGIVVDENEVYYNEFYNRYLASDEWEFYKEPEPDWDYIIKNKCLCWFWDCEEDNKVVGILKNISQNIKYKFNGVFLHCRPVRRDEVTFYEDRKNEHF